MTGKMQWQLQWKDDGGEYDEEDDREKDEMEEDDEEEDEVEEDDGKSLP